MIHVCKLNLQGKTPHEAWTGHKPDVSHLQEFGCDMWILIEGVNLSKLETKSRKFVLVGYEDSPKAIRYYNKETRKVYVSRNFRFV